MPWSRTVLALALSANLLAGSAKAGEADVIDVKVRLAGQRLYDFHLTVLSNDLGLEAYADRFEVLTPDGELLGALETPDPAEREQPFFEELRGVHVPPNIREVIVRARHKPTGFGGQTMLVTLPR